MATYPAGFANLIRAGFRPRQAIALLGSFAASGGGGGASSGGGPLGAKRAQVSAWTRSANRIVSNGYTFSNMPGNPPGTPPGLINGLYAFDVPASEAGWYSMRISLDVGFTGGTPERVLLTTNTYYNNRQILQEFVCGAGDFSAFSLHTAWGFQGEVYVPPFANPGFNASDGSYYMGGIKLTWPGAGTISDSSGGGDPRCWIDVVRLG